jgi:hypothetical protein
VFSGIVPIDIAHRSRCFDAFVGVYCSSTGFACPSSIASWSKRARRRGIFDVKLTFVRMQSRLLAFDAQVYNFKQGDRRSFSSFYVRRAIADSLAPWWSTHCVYSVAPLSFLALFGGRSLNPISPFVEADGMLTFLGRGMSCSKPVGARAKAAAQAPQDMNDLFPG